MLGIARCVVLYPGTSHSHRSVVVPIAASLFAQRVNFRRCVAIGYSRHIRTQPAARPHLPINTDITRGVHPTRQTSRMMHWLKPINHWPPSSLRVKAALTQVLIQREPLPLAWKRLSLSAGYRRDKAASRGAITADYIMPPMPPIPPAGIAGAAFSSFLSAMTHSVVRNIPAMDAAFSNATRVTLAGSITPAAWRFS